MLKYDLKEFALPEPTKFPLSITPPEEGFFKKFKVAKLFVGVSSKESLSVPADTEKFVGVELLPLPLESLPSVVAVVPELSEKFK